MTRREIKTANRMKSRLALVRRCPVGLRLNQPVEDGFRYGFGLRMDLQFLIDAAQVE